MTFIATIRQRIGRGGRDSAAVGGVAIAAPGAAPVESTESTAASAAPAIEIAPTDPLFGLLQATTGVVDVDRLELDSPAVRELRAAGMKIVVPLVAQGELIGALYLGPRLSDQDYSSDDRKLLSTLAAQAAPAIRVAQLVREQAVEIQARERLEQEMRVASLIQQQFLPHQLPELPDWQVAAYYGPARTVGGDFYDFIQLPGGRIGIVIGDVTGKGVPAALLMARTQSVLRGEAPRLVAPSKVLERANEILLPEMPARMFVTCLYIVLEPATGRVTYANAGHNLPIVATAEEVAELRATGMPLGLMPGMTYEEKDAVVTPTQRLLLYSDGIDEAHDPSGEMFGVPRLRGLMATDVAGSELIDHLLDELHAFVGKGWDQEDDITLVALQRTGGARPTIALDGTQAAADGTGPAAKGGGSDQPRGGNEAVAPEAVTPDAVGPHAVAPTEPALVPPGGLVLLELTLPAAAGNERMAMERVAAAVAPLGLGDARLERLKTAVSEAAMNAIEYGSQCDPEIPVDVQVTVAEGDLVVRITDQGLGGAIPDTEDPDLEAKLAGDQKPRGWGLFLIRHMVDEMQVVSHGSTQTVVLTLHLEGAQDAAPTI